jgi:hypothetical protein
MMSTMVEHAGKSNQMSTMRIITMSALPPT